MTYTTQHTVAVLAEPNRAPNRNATAFCTWANSAKNIPTTAGEVRRKSGRRRAAPKAQTRRRKERCKA